MFKRFAAGLTCLTLLGSACSTGGDAVLESAQLEATTDETIDVDAANTDEETGQAQADVDPLPVDGAAAPAFTVVAEATAPEVVARVAAADDADEVGRFAHPTPVGTPMVFRVVDGGADGSSEWIEVFLPVQPNGTVGFIKRADVTLTNNPYRVEIDRDAFNLRVFKQDALWLETNVAIGTGDTPTPVGDFYLLELLAPPNPDGDYGPFAFGLSGFSEVLESFGGADTAIIGLHGTNDPTSLGTNVSHGCIRLANDVITELAQTLPLGTPVLIV